MEDARRPGHSKLPQRRQRAEVADHWPIGHGHPGQRDHLSVDAGPRLRRRDAVRAVLLRTAPRDGRHLRRLHPYLLSTEGIHSVRIPRVTVRRAG